MTTAPRAVVKALWASYATPTSDGEVDSLVRGMPIAPALEARDRVLAWMAASGDEKSKQKKSANESAAPDKSVKLLDAEFEVVTLSRAANLGVPRADRRAPGEGPGQEAGASGCEHGRGHGRGADAGGGDVVLTAGAGKGVCVTFGDCERAVRSLARETRVLPMTVCRSGAIVELEVEVSDVSRASARRG